MCLLWGGDGECRVLTGEEGKFKCMHDWATSWAGHPLGTVTKELTRAPTRSTWRHTPSSPSFFLSQLTFKKLSSHLQGQMEPRQPASRPSCSFSRRYLKVGIPLLYWIKSLALLKNWWEEGKKRRHPKRKGGLLPIWVKWKVGKDSSKRHESSWGWRDGLQLLTRKLWTDFYLICTSWGSKSCQIQ